MSKVGSYSYLVQHAGDDKFGQFTVEVCSPIQNQS